jgi:hypothetical protein
MFCPRQYVVAFICCLMFLCIPGRSNAIQVDPYTHYTLGGGVVFEYETRRIDDGDSEEKSSIFTENYVLNFVGFIWDPRFLVFDTFFSYTDRDHDNDTGNQRLFKSSYTQSYYGFYSTLMRRSRLPVSFFASRDDTNDTVGSRESNRVRDEYGFSLNWLFKFRKLPHVQLDYTNRWQVSKNIIADEVEEDTHQTSLGLTFSKKFIYWRAINEATYEIQREKDENNLRNTDTGRDTDVFTFTSDVKYAQATELNLGASWYRQSELGTELDQEGKGMTIALDSRELETFTQDHSYVYYDTKSSTDDGVAWEATNQAYSGRLAYDPTRWLRLSQGINLSMSDRESLSGASDDRRFSSSTNLQYLITEHLATTESVRHEREENSSGDLVAGIIDRQRTDYTAALDYHRQIIRASFSTGYSLGFFDESVTYLEDIEATVPALTNADGLIQSAYIGLSGVRLKLVILGAHYSISDQQGEDPALEDPEVDRQTRSYDLSASTISNRFLTLQADYRNYKETSFVPRENSDVTTRTIRASSKPVRGASLNASYREEDRIDFLTGDTSTKDTDLMAYYSRRVLRGHMKVSASYSAEESASHLSANEQITIRYSAGYKTRLTSNMSLFVQAEREERRTTSELFFGTEAESDNTYIRESIEIDVPYRLRAWTLNTNYLYVGNDRSFSTSKRNEHKLTFTLARSFIRVF